MRQPKKRALYLFPTKALAQDQLRALRQFINGLSLPASAVTTDSSTATVHTDIQCATFDGDTAQDLRDRLLASVHIFLSNPDMLHVTMLGRHTQRLYREVFENLAFVVVDEMHTFKGCFGSHVALVLRRLRRICALYGRFAA